MSIYNSLMPYKCKRYKDTEIQRQKERERQRHFFSLLVWQHSLAGHSRVRVSYDMPGNRPDSSSSSCSIPPCLHYIIPCNSSCISFSCCSGCDCACLLTLEMAGDNDNLIMHGASQSGPAQPSPVQSGPSPDPLQVQDNGAGQTREGGPVLVLMD